MFRLSLPTGFIPAVSESEPPLMVVFPAVALVLSKARFTATAAPTVVPVVPAPTAEPSAVAEASVLPRAEKVTAWPGADTTRPSRMVAVCLTTPRLTAIAAATWDGWLEPPWLVFAEGVAGARLVQP